MSMGGGAFTAQNKILPGAYTKFVSTAVAATVGTRGVAALPLELNWGPEGEIFSVAGGDFNQTAMALLGYDPTAAELLEVREALKRAGTLLCWRVNGGGAKATATVGGLEVTAKYSGERGNDVQVAIIANGSANVDVVTYLAEAEMDRQTVAKATGSAGLVDNDYVTFSQAETLTPAAVAWLTGGANGTANAAAYTAWLNALEVEDFNALGYPGTDTAIKGLVTAFADRLREEQGKNVVAVVYQAGNADSIGVINVKNGVVLADGTTLPGHRAVAWVTGATAAAEINESLTNTPYDGAVDVDIKYTKSQYEAAIQAGEFVFYGDGSRARVLADINSRVSFGGGISRDWTSNRVVRVMDGWAGDVARAFGQRYMGVETNSDTGRSLFQAELVALGKEYQAMDAISDFLPEDVSVTQGSGKRDVCVTCALQPNDSMEKLYMTVQVN